MKDLKLKIIINRSVSEVFEFTTNPKNTPLWVPQITNEETNEWPIKIGSIYRNTVNNINWSEYKVSEFIKNKMFVFDRVGSSYHVKYVFKELPDNRTDLEYYEWVDEVNFRIHLPLKRLIN